MATIHPINRNPAILAELEIVTGKVAVKTPSGKLVMLKKPNFKRGKKKC
jgi:hypothetical protein